MISRLIRNHRFSGRVFSAMLYGAVLGSMLVPAATRAQECFPAPADLVGWWPLDETGGTIATDIESGNNGTLVNGPVFTTAQVANGLRFDGIDDHVIVSHVPLLDITGDVTVNLWAKRDTFNTQQGLIDKGAGTLSGADEPASYLMQFSTNNTITAGFERANASNAVISGPAIIDTGFHHYAYVRGGSAHRLYVDGQQVASDTFTGTPGATLVDLTIGSICFSNGPTCTASTQFAFFDGVMDEIQIFDRALTASEVEAIFDAGSAGDCKDEDGDGFRPPEDCDDANSAINPDAQEIIFNFVDENCDGNLGDCDPCADWQNHGQYVRCVSAVVGDCSVHNFTPEEADAFVSSAARSNIGKPAFTPQECQ